MGQNYILWDVLHCCYPSIANNAEIVSFISLNYYPENISLDII